MHIVILTNLRVGWIYNHSQSQRAALALLIDEPGQPAAVNDTSLC